MFGIIIDLIAGPLLSTASPVQTYPGYKPVSSKSDFRKLIERGGTHAKQLIITVPAAIIATVVGSLSVGTASIVAAKQIASSEAERIVQEESNQWIIDKENALINNLTLNNVSIVLGKSLDKYKFIMTQGARSKNLYFR